MKNRFARQNFLGEDGDAVLAGVQVGVVGLGGGGSHVAQQLAHLGVGAVVAIDPDIVEDTNLNRLVGATWKDVEERTPKVRIAERLIRGINPDAQVTPVRELWQHAAKVLQSCHAIFGCIDSYRDRDELERFARHFLIPYLDIGMDVHRLADGFALGGQVVLSSPGGLCLRCMGIVTDARLAEEAAHYGAAGGRPQVVWPNGLLASAAIGLFVQLVTPWHPRPMAGAYLEYDGNAHTLTPSNRLLALKGRACPHYPASEVGDPFFGTA